MTPVHGIPGDPVGWQREHLSLCPVDCRAPSHCRIVTVFSSVTWSLSETRTVAFMVRVPAGSHR
ncbi:hypothetical protein [Streptomyces sp. NPDC001068]|uniref:hypothetical protein n=1 Tax=Streptomyces sp. NPDC001068 TaxID=3364544 RepID=UPI0036A6DB74